MSIEKKRRTASTGSQKAAVDQKSSNSLRLAKRNLLELIEREILAYLDMGTVGLMPVVSKAMYKVTQAYFEQARKIRWNRGGDVDIEDDPDPEDEDGYTSDVGTALSFLRYCKSLRELHLPIVWACYTAERARAFLERCVRQNAPILEKVVISPNGDCSMISLSTIGALAACPNLSNFDNSLSVDVPSAAVYNAVLSDVAASCPGIVDLTLSDVPDDDEYGLFPGTIAAFLSPGTLRRLNLEDLPLQSVPLISGLSRLEALGCRFDRREWRHAARPLGDALRSLHCLSELSVDVWGSNTPYWVHDAWHLPPSVTKLHLEAHIAAVHASRLREITGRSPLRLIPLLNSNRGLRIVTIRDGARTDADSILDLASDVELDSAPLEELVQFDSMDAVVPASFLSRFSAPRLRALCLKLDSKTPASAVSALMVRLPDLTSCFVSGAFAGPQPAPLQQVGNAGAAQPAALPRQLPALQTLALSSADESLLRAVSLPRLFHLTLDGPGVHPAVLLSLAKTCPDLQSLSVSGMPSVTDAELFAAVKALPALSSLSVDCPQVSVVFLVKLPSFASNSLSDLSIGHSTAIPAEAFCAAVLRPLALALPQLRRFGCPLPTESVRQHLNDVLSKPPADVSVYRT